MLWSRLSRAGPVLVEPSDVVLRNAGDMAMLEVAATRLADRFADTPIVVLSDAPDRLPRYRPGVRPLDTAGRRAWRSGDVRSAVARGFVDTVASARLVVVAGMGGITDAFADYARDVLATLGLAIQHGVPTAMMGQGIGPLAEPGLRALAGRILPQVDRIALREGRAGSPLLRGLGVSAERVLVTGDDAIELALPGDCAGEPALGHALGINLRAADYAAVTEPMIAAVRLGVQRAAGRERAPLAPIPISRVPGEEDAATIRRLVEGHEVPAEPDLAFDGPRDVIAQSRRCRVVVAGSYHAGVFALASGVPVVGLASSDYYRDKLLGLADQFGCGCEVVSLHEPDLAERIEAAVGALWAAAGELRPRLLAAARRQRASARAAYDGLPALVRQRRRGRAAYRHLRAVAARWLR